MRALLAEDSKMMSDYLSAILQRLGFVTIDVAKDGVEAVRLLGSSQYNLIIIDRNMPGMSGVEVLQNLRYSPIPISAPILMVTGSADRELVEIIRRDNLPISGIVAKPFTFDTFKEKYDRIAAQVRGANRKATAPESSITDLGDEIKRYDGDLFSAMVVKKPEFLGIAFKGVASRTDMILIKRCFDEAVLSSDGVIAVNTVEVSEYDAFFIGFFLMFAGTIIEGGREIRLITRSDGMLMRLGIDRIITTHLDAAEFYQSVGYDFDGGE